MEVGLYKLKSLRAKWRQLYKDHTFSLTNSAVQTRLTLMSLSTGMKQHVCAYTRNKWLTIIAAKGGVTAWACHVIGRTSAMSLYSIGIEYVLVESHTSTRLSGTQPGDSLSLPQGPDKDDGRYHVP